MYINITAAYMLVLLSNHLHSNSAPRQITDTMSASGLSDKASTREVGTQTSDLLSIARGNTASATDSTAPTDSGPQKGFPMARPSGFSQED